MLCIGASIQAGAPDAGAEATAQAPIAAGVMPNISQTLSMLIYHHLSDGSPECDSDTSCLSAAIGDLFEVMMFLKNLNGWINLGLALGLLYPTLEILERDNDTCDDCKRKMLAAWLRKQDDVSKRGVPSWSVLRDALKAIGENDLADRISFAMMVSCKYLCTY